MPKIPYIAERALIAGTGGSLALFIDALRLKDASLLQHVAERSDLSSASGHAGAIALSAAALIALSAVSVFYLKPLSRKGALASGFMAMAVVALLAR